MGTKAMISKHYTNWFINSAYLNALYLIELVSMDEISGLAGFSILDRIITSISHY